MAKTAVKRIQKAMRFQNITPEMLDSEGVINWNATGEDAEESRPVTHMGDAFEPPFDESELGSDAHVKWEENVRRDFD